MNSYTEFASSNLPVPAPESLVDIYGDMQSYFENLHGATGSFEEHAWKFNLMELPAGAQSSRRAAAAPTILGTFDTTASCHSMAQHTVWPELHFLGSCERSLFLSTCVGANDWFPDTPLGGSEWLPPLPSLSTAAIPSPQFSTQSSDPYSLEAESHGSAADSLTSELGWSSSASDDDAASATNANGAITPQRCPHPACTSRVLFTRQCDINKHFHLHLRTYTCRTPAGKGCLVAFATAKDRRRHESSHAPSIVCNICGRIFSRQDNLLSHRRKLHPY